MPSVSPKRGSDSRSASPVDEDRGRERKKRDRSGERDDDESNKRGDDRRGGSRDASPSKRHQPEPEPDLDMGPGRKSVFSRVTKPAAEEGDKVSVFSRVTKPVAEEGDKVSVFSRITRPAAAAAKGGKEGGAEPAADADAAAAATTAGAAAEPAADAAAAAAAAPEVAKRVVNLGKTGGVYIPPFKLARMMADVSDRVSPEYQRLTWEALKKSVNGIINKVNGMNIKAILVEVFRENLVRGRGLFCRSMMKSQLASPAFSPVYAGLVAVVNTKFPELGELLLGRLLLQFKRSYKRNDKPVCSAAARFLGHLINQGVAHEVLALEMLILMLESPSDDSVEMAVEFTKEVGSHLADVSPSGLNSVFERFRSILHEGEIDKRVQFIIEGLFAIRKAGFTEHPAIKPELDLVEAEDQITHELGLDDNPDAQTGLDIFKVDDEYEEHERQHKAIMREILGEDDVSDDEGKDGKEKESGSESEEDEDSEDEAQVQQQHQQRQVIQDATETNLVNLRRTIYLTIMSSMDFEEAGHKLMKMGVPPGQEIELVTMLIECCSQERTYKRFFGLLSQRFCYVARVYQEHFSDCFRQQYMVIHRLETNKLRNVASLFAHLLATDALPWEVMQCIRLTEEETTSSSRIFIKYLFQELSSTLGLIKLNERMNDPACQDWFDGIFPKDTQANLRFAINFFTSIGLGGLTDSMRAHYKEIPRILAERQAKEEATRPKAPASSSSSSDSDSSSSSSSSSDSSSSSSSDSESEGDRRRKKGARGGKGKGKGGGGGGGGGPRGGDGGRTRDDPQRRLAEAVFPSLEPARDERGRRDEQSRDDRGRSRDEPARDERGRRDEPARDDRGRSRDETARDERGRRDETARDDRGRRDESARDERGRRDEPARDDRGRSRDEPARDDRSRDEPRKDAPRGGDEPSRDDRGRSRDEPRREERRDGSREDRRRR
ncbi:hypothetical protein FOA52_007336 [Chlamydomonas sp. UWO 241]|nr:hypothetical protein FOA52_007336 [Chlamydomonas sp. UWO 241]